MLLTMIYLFLLVSVVLLLNLLIAQLNQTYEYINKAAAAKPVLTGWSSDVGGWYLVADFSSPGPLSHNRTHNIPILQGILMWISLYQSVPQKALGSYIFQQWSKPPQSWHEPWNTYPMAYEIMPISKVIPRTPNHGPPLMVAASHAIPIPFPYL